MRLVTQEVIRSAFAQAELDLVAAIAEYHRTTFRGSNVNSWSAHGALERSFERWKDIKADLIEAGGWDSKDDAREKLWWGKKGLGPLVAEIEKQLERDRKRRLARP